MHVSYSPGSFICEAANQTPVWLILCSQKSVQVCWLHLLWGGGSALNLGQWTDFLLTHDIFCAGLLFWFWWQAREENVCTLLWWWWLGDCRIKKGEFQLSVNKIIYMYSTEYFPMCKAALLEQVLESRLSLLVGAPCSAEPHVQPYILVTENS